MLSYPTATGGGLYAIRFPDTHYYYGGRAVSFTGRWRRHLRALEGHKHPNRHLQAVFDKYGPPTFDIILTGDSIQEMMSLEQDWLKDNYGQQGCLNQSPFARGGQGKCSEATKAKLRGRKCGEATKAYLSALFKGRKNSPEATRKVSEALKGRKHSDQHRLNNSLSHKGQVATKEAKLKMSLSSPRKGKPIWDSLKVGVVAANQRRKGWRQSQDAKEHLSLYISNLIWVCCQNQSKRIGLEQLQDFLAQGWKKGRKFSP